MLNNDYWVDLDNHNSNDDKSRATGCIGSHTLSRI